jgi:hypothetical protein
MRRCCRLSPQPQRVAAALLVLRIAISILQLSRAGQSGREAVGEYVYVLAGSKETRGCFAEQSSRADVAAFDGYQRSDAATSSQAGRIGEVLSEWEKNEMMRNALRP